MNIVSFGGGTNSAAMIIGMVERNIPIDLITFSDTGSEFPHTYKFMGLFDEWLDVRGLPKIITAQAVDKDGKAMTLEEHCLMYGYLPSIAYGIKQCSVRFKIQPQEKFCNNHQPCREVWERGERVNRYIGYDSGEARRVIHAKAKTIDDSKYVGHYPLYDWGWDREKCVEVVVNAGLPKPSKSSCFFCPSMKKHEIESLWKTYPKLFERAAEIERRAEPNNKTAKGLGRDWSWRDYKKATEAQMSLFDFEDSTGGCICDMPCGCYDG
jgi:hypothetical protein